MNASRLHRLPSLLVALFAAALFSLATAQTVNVNGNQNNVVVNAPFAANVIVPQARSFGLASTSTVEQLGVSEVRASVRILQQVATVTLEIGISNPTARIQEAELLLPLPRECVVRGFDFQGSAQEPTARLLPAAEARGTYNAIVAKTKDPALLEFAGYFLIRSSVFPVPAHGTQKVRIVYEQICAAEGDRVDFLLPRSESLSNSGVPWHIELSIESQQDIASVYSPSHELETVRNGTRVAAARVKEPVEPGPFQLSWLRAGNGINATLFACPEIGSASGHFLLLAALPEPPADAARQKREVILVLDRSGSMAGEKWKQALEAARQVVSGLDDGERFAIVDFSDTVGLYAPTPLEKNSAELDRAHAHLARLSPAGGTNIGAALGQALALQHAPEFLPIVLFLTDGLPTVGERDETRLRDLATKSNPEQRRIYTFGVGHDVNAPLLDAVAARSRAKSSYVQPNEAVEAKVSEVYRNLRGPVFTSPLLEILDEQGQLDTRLLSDVLPGALPDLYAGDELSVLGRYNEQRGVVFRVRGDYLGAPRTFEFRFDLHRSATTNSFVPRLWASRRVATLVDEVRQAGAGPQQAAGDARFGELVQEITTLSTRYGILTEYTSFLALEGTPLLQQDSVLAQVRANLRDQGQQQRSGRAAVSQSVNNQRRVAQVQLNRVNRMFDAQMRDVQFTGVQQLGIRTFFKRGDTWIDSRVAGLGKSAKIDRHVEFGSGDHRALLDLLRQNGQQAALSMAGDIVIEEAGKVFYVKRPLSVASTPAALPDTQQAGAPNAAPATPVPGTPSAPAGA
jgi:Ca-activated chloride channel family protein